jgi:hypothetical protein
MIDETKSEKPTGDIILNSAQGSALDDAAHDELEWNPERGAYA